jgi:cytochrome c peroxidase
VEENVMKRQDIPGVLVAVAVAGMLIVGCGQPEKGSGEQSYADKASAEAVPINEAQLGMFQPLPEVMESPENPITPAKVDLGRMLYYETRISKNHDISCNTCHDLANFGVDGKPTSPGHKGQLGDRNSNTVYNAAGQFVQFWDGRAKDVEEQAKGPVLNPVEMAMPDEASVIAVLKSMPGYVEAFEKAFPGEADPVTYDNFAKAVGAFERKLVTPSRWDKFLEGDQAALSAEERKGFNKFVEAGCTTCHIGPYVGGNMFQKTGLVKPWPRQEDKGRAMETKNAADDMMFKVPILRNITKTGPYFHDGSEPSLENAVKLMAEYQLGKTLTDEDTKLIVAWLETLTGEIPTAYIKEPELPASTDKTPKPDPS